MSFAIWNQKPPFEEKDLTPGEKIYQVGDKWVVTDDPAKANQAAIDAVLNAPAPPPDLIDELRTALKADPTLLDKLKALK